MFIFITRRTLRKKLKEAIEFYDKLYERDKGFEEEYKDSDPELSKVYGRLAEESYLNAVTLEEFAKHDLNLWL